MKKDKHILTTFIIVVLTFLIGGYQTCQAQLSDGNYYYSNNKNNVTLIVMDVGQRAFVTIERKDCNSCRADIGIGEWFQVNLKGADEGYSGPYGWYNIVLETGDGGDDRYAEFELDDFNNKSYNYEIIKMLTPNSKEKTILKLTHYIKNNDTIEVENHCKH
tara:strand:+ start:19 stop:501 length:483 start_codon:yes stop_codon:yes gene_type:complete